MGRAVAFVTGASRGIGRASAIALARAGFDVAFTARIVHEGEGRVEMPYSGGPAAAPVAVAGSLETTAAEIEAEGVDALPVQMDLLATESLDPGFTQTESMNALGLPPLGAATPDVTGAVVARLATPREETKWDGGTVDTHTLCAELGLVAGWPPPRL